MKKALFTSIASVLLSVSAAAAASSIFDSQIPPELIDEMRSTPVEGMVEIPVRSVKAVESDGQIRYVSDNGRFVFEGRLIDVMQRKPLDTLGEINTAVNQLDITSLGIDLEALNSISIGKGTERVTGFIDPNCPPCLEVIKQAQALQDDYTFTFIVVPALGEVSSHEAAKRVHCAASAEDVIPALLSKKLSRIKVRPDCPPAVYDMTLLFADMVGVNGVPFLIAPTGHVMRGQPQNMEAWLKNPQ